MPGERIGPETEIVNPDKLPLPETIYLRQDPWSQYRCTIRNIRTDDFDVFIELFLPKSGKHAVLEVPRDSDRGSYLLKTISLEMIGQTVLLLFTDIPKKEILVKSI